MKTNKIINFLHKQRGCDFSGNRFSMLKRRITKRFHPTGSDNIEEYYTYIQNHPEELNELIDILTINVSSFFRDTLNWEYLSKCILPVLLEKKKAGKDNSIRIWSAGCASGEEPYSMAILINELFQKEKSNIMTLIFATDIDTQILKRAKEAQFNFEAIKNIKFGLMKKYFSEESDSYVLNYEIRNKVKFSKFNLLDDKKYSPSESVFGNFDIVMCRNVLIYFNTDYQNIVFAKLYRSLNTGGYLILGEAEIPVEDYKNKFNRINKCYKIYQKR